jgi:signal transduction histidine kinase
MGERAEAAGGEFIIHSAPGGGTRVEVRVPVTVPAERTAAEV